LCASPDSGNVPTPSDPINTDTVDRVSSPATYGTRNAYDPP
jgi:hypothetical protein